MKAEITQDELLNYGFIPVEDIVVKAEKILIPSDDDGDNEVALIITSERNTLELALHIPGGTLFLNVENLEQLAVIEKAIIAYSSEY